MKSFPQLETERLILRKLKPEDSRDLFHYFSKDEVTKYYDLESFVEVRQAEELIDNWNNRFEELKGIRWAITIRSEERVIGTCGFHNWSKEHFKVEIGYELAPEYWRQGIMTEVLNEIIQYGFIDLGLNRIEALIDPDNISSRKLLEKVGLHEEGYLKDYFYEKNQFVDAVIFAILKKEYKKICERIQR
jgi:ribosomal-protein-alanine N-acetyltransferase